MLTVRERPLLWISLGLMALAMWGCRAAPSSTPRPAWTPLSMPSPTSTPIPQAARSRGQITAPLDCQNDARFLEDLTIPDGSIVQPGERLDKRWSVQNSGTCDWGPDYRLVHVVEDAFEGPQSVALYPARAGSTALWQVVLVAPSESGDFLSRWQARAPDGSLFGDEVYLLVVVEPPTPTPTATPLISATPQEE